MLLCRQEKPGKEYWLLPGRRRRGRGDARARRCTASSARSSGSGTTLALRGPDRRRRVDRARLDARRPARRPRHLRRRPLEPLARGRRERTTPAVRGTRLFSLDELEEIVVHPPMKRFVERWRPGTRPCTSARSGAIALGAVATRLCRRGRGRAWRRPRAPRASSSSASGSSSTCSPVACASASASRRSASHGLRGRSGPWRYVP